jgi:hypothetical protein
MKICPQCQKTYSDENLNFCLDDGTTLTQSGVRSDSPPATVIMNQARPTDQPAQFGNQSGAAQGNWNTPNRYSMPPPPQKSKTWLWVLGILGGLMLICGGGLVGFIFWAASLENNNSNNNRIIAGNSNDAANSENKTKSTLTSKTSVQKIDLSRWADGDTDLGNTEYVDNELFMGSKQKGYYYVLAAKAEYKTENATTKVNVRNVNNAKTALGFGLIIHSNPVPLRQDYAFLIDSVNKKFRIVRHIPGDEISVVGWTRSPAVKDGTDTNTLEVRDANKTMNFYINGEIVKTLPNTDGYSGGVTGLYSGDAVQIAFSNLEISK